jgi:lactate dehydrogenase-like 2-hydroxyacid dehydrogenase
MTEPILVVTTRYTKEVEDRISRDYSVRRSPNQFPFSQQELLSAAEGADALFITPADRLDFAFFQKVSPTVKIIATFSVGFEHIDLEAAARRNIPVAYTPGVNSEATADIAMLLLLGASRRAYEAQELVRTREWKSLSPDMLLGWQVGGKVLGIFGMGRVGQAVARRARGFGMKIHYCDGSQLPAEIAGDAVYHKGSVGSASRNPVLEPARPGDSADPSLPELQSHKPSAPRGDRGEHGSRRIGGRRRPYRCSQERAGRRCRTRRI